MEKQRFSPSFHCVVSRKYTWETPLKNILGKDFQLEDEFLSSHVTIKDVLLHRTGLATSSMAFIAGFPAAFTREELIR